MENGGIKILSDSYTPGLESNRIQIKKITIIISNIIGIFAFSFAILSFFIVAAGSMGMLKESDILWLCMIIVIPGIGMGLSFRAWRYYDQETTTISHLGFRFIQSPYYILLILILLIVGGL